MMMEKYTKFLDTIISEFCSVLRIMSIVHSEVASLYFAIYEEVKDSFTYKTYKMVWHDVSLLGRSETL